MMLHSFKLSNHLMRRWFAGLLAIVFFSLTLTAQAADLPGMGGLTPKQDSHPVAHLDTPEAVHKMVSRLSDKEVRELLLKKLDATAVQTEKAEAASSGIGAFFKSWARGIYNSASLAIARVPGLYGQQKEVINNFIDHQGEAGAIRFLMVLALALVLGVLAERAVMWLTRKWRQRVANPVGGGSYEDSLKLLGLRFLLDMAGLITFIIVTSIVIETVQADTADGVSFLILNYLIFFPRLMWSISRFLLSPRRPELRIVHTDDQTARFLHRHQLGLFLLMGFGTGLLDFNFMNGAQPGAMRLGYWFNIATHIYYIYIVWNARRGLTDMLSGWDHEGAPKENAVAKYYPYFLVAAAITQWLVVELIVAAKAFELLKYNPQEITLLLLLFIPAFDTIIRGAVTYMMPPMSGTGEVAAKAYQSAKSSYVRIGRILLFGVAIFVMAFIWQIRPADLAARNVDSSIAANLLEFLAILSVGYLFWELVTLWVNRKLAAEETAAGIDLNAEEPGGGEGGAAGASRLSTILPLMRFTLQTIIIATTLLIGLSHIGIDITPLLAGAGVLGIAVGFGAQKLVQDVVSGIFFLIDDAFRAGEYISIEGTLGTVEKISLRSMQLRHHRGAVHTIPYGEIPKLTNFSRDWVIMKLMFTVPFDTDLNKVKKIFKQIGKDMMEIEEFKEDFLQPFKSQGVLEVNDVGIVIRGKFMAKPGTQFMIRKELYNRVQKAFDENGIQFARKEVRVNLSNEAEDLPLLEKTVVAGAAAEVATEVIPVEEGAKKPTV